MAPTKRTEKSSFEIRAFTERRVSDRFPPHDPMIGCFLPTFPTHRGFICLQSHRCLSDVPMEWACLDTISQVCHLRPSIRLRAHTDMFSSTTSPSRTATMPALRTKRIAIVALLILAGLICASRYTGQPRREHPRDNSFFEETPFDSPDADATQIVLKTPPDFSELLPDIEVDTTRAYEAETRKAIRRVFECMATYGDDCANRPEGHIVIVA